MKVAHKVLQQEQHMTSKCKNLATQPSEGSDDGGGRTATWKVYLMLYPDWRMRTVSSIPVYLSCLSTRLSLKRSGSWGGTTKAESTS